MEKVFLVDKIFVNSRFDRWIRKNIENVPQSLIEKNIRKGNIKVNNTRKKSSYRLKENDKIIFYNLKFIKSSKKKFKNYTPTKKEIKLSNKFIIENNDDFVVVNKPPGLAVQSGTKSLKNIVDILRKNKVFDNSTPFLVHRIDKETTGVLIVAKNRKSAQLFTSLFRLRKIHKTYMAIVIGELDKKSGEFIDTLFHYEGTNKIMTKAITRYNVIDSKNNYSLLRLNPLTGRKHQLRKQLFIRGHPVFGDTKYKFHNSKVKKKQNLMLHAYEIYFSINDVRYNFSADLPLYFKNFLIEKSLKIY